MYAFGVAFWTYACNVAVGPAVTTTADVRCREVARQNADAGEHIDFQHHAYSLEWVLSPIDKTLLADR